MGPPADSARSLSLDEQGDDDDRADFHSFAWLTDLRAVGSDAARRRARDLMSEWFRSYAAWDEFAWRSDLLASRIASWITEHDFFCASANEDFRSEYFKNLTRQTRHLFRIAPGADKGATRFAVLKALFYAVVAIPGYGSRVGRVCRLLEQDIRRQILADGTHVGRCPSTQLTVLRMLVDIRTCLNGGGHEVPVLLRSAIDRMTPALRALRHGDGRLGIFNGASECDSLSIEAVLTQTNVPTRAHDELRYGGFQRLKAGRTLILVDVGAPPPSEYDRTAHAGTLSLEISVSRERLIVNCGAPARMRGPRLRAQRSTAAHSTLVVNDTNSSEIREDGTFGRRPHETKWRREATDGALFIEASHDGYREPFGAVHSRCVYLSADGHDIRGEDSLFGAQPCRFAIRFHLHPAIRSSLLAGGEAALLRLPSGEGWRFQASGATLHLDQSIYFGGGEGGRRTDQLVLEGQSAEGGSVVKWALKRIGPVT